MGFSTYPSLLATGAAQYSYYATLNPIDKTDGSLVLSSGNLAASTVATGGGYRAVRSTVGVSSASASALIYLEVPVILGTGCAIGFSNHSWLLSPSGISPTPGGDGAGNSWAFIMNGAGFNQKAHAGVYTTYGASFGAGDTIMLAMDMTNGFAYFGKNGTWLNSGVPASGASGTGAAFSGLTGTLFPTLGCYGGNAYSYTINFGATSFTFTPPAGYSGLHH